ncbi:MAG: hypothetical protein JW947_08140 [Sedimentisphaerales bacterium]|nr:hypothetical protein [Sedimentisphaerales bacterium]
MITEYLFAFEHRIIKVPPVLLMGIAIVMVVLGLFVLFGGFGYKKILYIIIGAFCGAGCAISMTSINYLLATAFVAGGAILCFRFRETFLSFVIAILAATYGYSILISPYFGATKELIDILRQLTIGVPFYNWPILLGAVLAPFALTSSWYAGASACYSSLTASIMFMASTIMLLKRSGYGASGMISSNALIIIMILTGITAIGMVFQLLIMPRISARFATTKQASKFKMKKSKQAKQQKSESGEVRKASWRTS